MFYWQKKTWNKKILFPVDKKLVFTSRNERLVKKYVPVEEKSVAKSIEEKSIAKS